MALGALEVPATTPSFEGSDELERLFARHMQARAVLRSVARAEKESLAEIIWLLKTVPLHERQKVLATCVMRAASSIVPDTEV